MVVDYINATGAAKNISLKRILEDKMDWLIRLPLGILLWFLILLIITIFLNTILEATK
jgi:hypothetical protein